MSIKQIEESRTTGIPFELYEFVYGEGETDKFTYTDAEKPLSLEGVTFTPLAVSRGAVSVPGVA